VLHLNHSAFPEKSVAFADTFSMKRAFQEHEVANANEVQILNLKEQ